MLILQPSCFRKLETGCTHLHLSLSHFALGFAEVDLVVIVDSGVASIRGADRAIAEEVDLALVQQGIHALSHVPPERPLNLLALHRTSHENRVPSLVDAQAEVGDSPVG
jgi:hypothetical protein